MANTVAAAAAALGAPLRLRVLQAYLHVRRASKNLFTGDDRAQYMAWERTKNEFLKHKDLREPSKVEELVKAGEEAALFIRRNLVQAESTDTPGTFRLNVKPYHELTKWPATGATRGAKAGGGGGGGAGCKPSCGCK